MIYVPFSLQPQFTLALRAGADHRFGNFPFFDGAVLGGATALRGYRRERFTGETIAFANAEIRTKVFDLSTYLAPIEVGVLGFADAGRVWYDRPAFTDPFQDVQLGVGGGCGSACSIMPSSSSPSHAATRRRSLRSAAASSTNLAPLASRLRPTSSHG